MSEDFRLELSREKRDDTGRENPIKLHNCKLATVLRASANPPDVLKKRGIKMKFNTPSETFFKRYITRLDPYCQIGG